MKGSTDSLQRGLPGAPPEHPGITMPGRKSERELVSEMLAAQREREARLARSREAGAAGSSAGGLDAPARVNRYVAQNGVRRLTPRQARRIVKQKHKREG